MVVVVIIGILVAIAIPIYNNVTADARLNAIYATERTIAGAYMIFTADTSGGTWPQDFVSGFTGDDFTSVTSDDWSGDFVRDGFEWPYNNY